MRAQKLTIAAVALAAGLSLTACQGNDDASGSANDSSSAQTSSDASQENNSGGDSESSGSDNSSAENGGSQGEGTSGGGSDSGSSEQASGSGTETLSGTPTCTTSQLAMTISGGMGEGDHIVNMKNTGGSTCALKGFPGVDLNGKDGSVSAARTDSKPSLVKIKSGSEARFTLHTPRNDTGGSGVDFTSITVTPPNETHSTSLHLDVNLPASDSTTQQVRVEPVGWGK